MFNTMINGESSFTEKKEGKVQVPFSNQAVEMMVQFMYGMELKDLDLEHLDVYLELIEIGGVYGVKNLDKAAAEKLKPHVNRENVFCFELSSFTGWNIVPWSDCQTYLL